MSLDAEAFAWLRKEQDELLQTTRRLCSEHGMAHEEHDQAIRERDEAQQRIGSLQAELETATTRRLGAEGVSAGLGMELIKARRNL